MSAKVIDGKRIAEPFIHEAAGYITREYAKPRLATVVCGGDSSTDVYVGIKKKICNSVGIDVEIIRPDERKLKETISMLNNRNDISGILVQLPLFQSIDESAVLSSIDPQKDVDGLHPLNMGRLLYHDETMPPCTPYGIVQILEKERIAIEGASVAILGRNIHVGKPLSVMLTNRGATVTVCHTKTRDMSRITRDSDIVISAVGKPNLLNGSMIKTGATVIDVGITRIGGRIHGDVDMNSVMDKAYAVTPVPGGVGPMTVAMLVRNVVNAYKMQRDLNEKK